MKKSNYEITKIKMQSEFLKYDQKKMQEKFSLKSDEEYLYIKFIGRTYRIHRLKGTVEWSDHQFQDVFEADYHEAMSVFDVLCDSKEDCCLSGEFCPVNSLPGVAFCATPGKGLFDEESKYFDHKTELLSAACERLGGKKQGRGDVAYLLPAFDFLPVLVEFWESDEEFPASFQILWDKNTLDYMHYETTYYVRNHLIKRLRETMEQFRDTER